MSYISIVRGKIIETTGGDDTTYAKNITYSAQGTMSLTGVKEGVSYDKDPKKPPVFENNRNSINVNLNIFFDGTGNNKTNTEARDENSPNHKDYLAIGNKEDDSFENGLTNVARGFDAISPSTENQVRVYVEGMGTENLKEDTIFPGVMFGMGDTGVPAKVTKGCLDAGNEMYKKKYHRKTIDILYVNVYGFSRGAAAARHFIHVASKQANYSSFPEKVSETQYKYKIYPDYFFNDTIHQFDLILENTSFLDQYGYFGACLLKNKINPKRIVFNFVGLYDCVASYGLFHGDNTNELKLDSISKAKFVFHMASDDEYRKNFPLTNILSSGLRGFEVVLPGVHSDIGGSYLDNVKEVSVVDNIKTFSGEDSETKAKESRDKRYNKFKAILESEGWYAGGELVKQFYNKDDFNDKILKKNPEKRNYGLVGTRTLGNSYDKIPLHFMIEHSQKFEVKYLQTKLDDLSINDEFINHIKNDLGRYVNQCALKHKEHVDVFENVQQNFEDLGDGYNNDIKKIHYRDFVEPESLKKLRNKYLHWSAKTNKIGLSPTVEGPAEQAKRKRDIYHG